MNDRQSYNMAVRNGDHFSQPPRSSKEKEIGFNNPSLAYINGLPESKPGPSDVSRPSDHPERGTWNNKAEFLLSCVGMSVGLGNVWRFPYLAYEHGGAAFLIAYLILQLLVGKPMYLMELVMGQFSGKGPTKVWDMNPAAKGIGVSMCIISLICAIYYNIIIAYSIFFFFSSMQSTLPWTECKQEWIDEYNCYVDDGNTTCAANKTCKSASEVFFEAEVLEKSSGLDPDSIGTPLWKLTLCLLAAWLIVVSCLIKGIKSSGKVVYFTATFPYVILLILLVRGSLLDGAIDGVEFFIVPEWDKLGDIDVWVAALGQMFFSLSVSFGGIIMFGSYNKFNNQIYYDSLIISVMDLVTSIVAGFVVFTTLGGLAHDLNTSVEEVATGGYGLAFVVYPQALANLPIPQLWSVLFFFMLVTLGMDSEFGLLETVMTCIQDEWPKMRRYKSQLAVGLGVSCFLLGLPCACPGGDYVVALMDHYGADFSVLFVSCMEVISVMWVYGVNRFMKDVEYMLGSKIHGWPYWIFCWSICPIIIAGLIVYRMIEYNPPTYDSGEEFEQWAQGVGWVLLTVAMCPIPIVFFWRIWTAVRTNQDIVQFMFKPNKHFGPNDGGQNYHWDGHGVGASSATANRPVDKADFARVNEGYV